MIVGLGNVFLDTTPTEQTMKEKNRLNGLHQNLKPLCFKDQECKKTTLKTGENIYK